MLIDRREEVKSGTGEGYIPGLKGSIQLQADIGDIAGSVPNHCNKGTGDLFASGGSSNICEVQ